MSSRPAKRPRLVDLDSPLGPADRAKIVFTYFVPYSVATYAAVQAIRRAK